MKVLIRKKAMNNTKLENIDHSAIINSQITLILLNIFAYVINSPMLVVITALIMLSGVLRKKPAFGFIYTLLFKPIGLVKPKVQHDNHAPHQFAQIVGTVFMFTGAAFLLLQFPILGWVFIGIVTALAALNAFGGFCVGCAMYYWLGRLGIRRFDQIPPEGTVPGRRPKG